VADFDNDNTSDVEICKVRLHGMRANSIMVNAWIRSSIDQWVTFRPLVGSPCVCMNMCEELYTVRS